METEPEVPDEPPWDENTEPDRLRLSRGSARHSQGRCAAEISADGGGVSQQQVSAWENKEDTPSSNNLAAARRYIDRHRAKLDPLRVQAQATAKVIPIRGGGSSQPLPSDLQEAIAMRIASGTPMNRWDVRAIELARGEDHE